RTPLGYLASLQTSNGSIRYSRLSAQTPVWVTAQAIDALERRAFPLAPPPRAAHSARRATGAGAGGGGAKGSRHAPRGKSATNVKRGAAAASPAATATAGAHRGQSVSAKRAS